MPVGISYSKRFLPFSIFKETSLLGLLLPRRDAMHASYKQVRASQK